MRFLITSLHQTHRRMVTTTAVLHPCRIQGATGMSGCELSVPASVLNEGAGTLREVSTCWKGDAAFTREFLENVQGLVEELVLSGRSDPPSKVAVSVGEIAGQPALLAEGIPVRSYRVCIAPKIPKALGALMMH